MINLFIFIFLLIILLFLIKYVDIKKEKEQTRINIVIAGTFGEYNDYIRYNNLKAKEYRFINSTEKLLGLRNVNIILTGRYWLSKCFYDKYLSDLIADDGNRIFKSE